ADAIRDQVLIAGRAGESEHATAKSILPQASAEHVSGCTISIEPRTSGREPQTTGILQSTSHFSANCPFSSLDLSLRRRQRNPRTEDPLWSDRHRSSAAAAEPRGTGPPCSLRPRCRNNHSEVGL